MRGSVRRLVAGMALTAGVASLGAGCATSTAGSGSPAGGLAGGPAPSSEAPTGGAEPAPTTAAPTSAAPSTPAPTTAPTTAPPGRSVAFANLRIPLTPGTTARADGGLLCVVVQGDSGCTLEVMDIGAVRSAGGSVSTPDPGTPGGWWWGSDVPTCGDTTTFSEVTRSSVVENGFKKIGPRTAEYGSWIVSCKNGDLNFDPRLWWLPSSQLAFRSRTSVAGRGEAVDKILAGVTFG